MNFGLWTTDNKAFIKKGRSFLRCQCVCGLVKDISKYALTTNRSKGCVKCTRAKQPNRENSPSWKGGRHRDEKGYIQIYQPEHPRAKKNGYVREHTVVMERKLE